MKAIILAGGSGSRLQPDSEPGGVERSPAAGSAARTGQPDWGPGSTYAAAAARGSRSLE